MLLFQQDVKQECDHVMIKTAVHNENKNKIKDREKQNRKMML